MEPSELRHQKRKYTEAFETDNVENNNKVELWTRALCEAAYISGWSVNQFGSELQCIEKIVDTIFQMLHPEGLFSHGLSSSPSSQRWNHDIFLSFVGECDSETFVDPLHSALVKQGIDTYKSSGQSPLNAIEESKITVIIFTNNYAGSSRCLMNFHILWNVWI
ncbi:disease resistance protein TAO1-like [Bidens hawaiensis]|uniref:disease resistance protein TAO1-like n=1 Tax=Bidens hawaiensis TaxID=980011 RepID=UPI004049AD70